MTSNSETKATILQTSPGDQSYKPNDSQQRHERVASLTEVEQAFLSALLIDQPPSSPSKRMSAPPVLETYHSHQPLPDTQRSFTHKMLFSVPQCLIKADGAKTGADGRPPLPKPVVKKGPENYRLQVGLWQAHEDGVTPKVLSRMASTVSKDESEKENGLHSKGKGSEECNNPEVDGVSLVSDREVCDISSNFSWDENDTTEHFDAWQVLKDEYAQEYGFDYKPDGNYVEESELSHNQFKIIGTSADDISSHPHVVSPPLLDSIMNFLPQHLQNQNYWMKYSLIRDGASLDTFKAYVRGAKDSILAIETTRGQVFGVYTSSPWRTSPTFFGGAPSVVWKMRYNRNTPCHSLFEQATLESEIDVFFLLDSFLKVQLCTHDRIGIGVGNMNRYDSLGNIIESEQDEEKRNGKNYGFAICLEDDLLSGTTSRSACYKSPCLVDPTANGEPFDVLNLELWTLTPAFSQESAEKLEMTQYFVSESIRSSGRSDRSVSYNSGAFSSRDLDQHSFYRRIGHDDSHEELRDQWQLQGMTDGAGAGNRGMGASPRYAK
jgi:hypothetical protein